jgi:hypothetical protein
MLQPTRFGGSESGFPGSSESARRWRAMTYQFRGFTALSAFIGRPLPNGGLTGAHHRTRSTIVRPLVQGGHHDCIE